MSAMGVRMGSMGTAAKYVPSLAWIIVYSIFYLKGKKKVPKRRILCCVCVLKQVHCRDNRDKMIE